MPRAIWSGAISFGLVNIPVKMVTATRSKDVSFHMLHAKDGARIRYQKLCPKDGKEVTMDDIVRGFEVAKGQYVTFTDEELESLDPKASRTIDIQDFAKSEDIDPAYYDKPYYLVPDKNAEKPYALLLGALQKTGKVGIARVVMREKEHLVALRAKDDAIVMSTMRWADEIVPADSVVESTPATKLDKRELTMAAQLVDALTAEFDPQKYHNEYRERLMEYIEQKAAGHEVVVEPTVAPVTRTANLMDALQESLKAAGTKPSRGRAKGPARPAKKAARGHAGHARHEAKDDEGVAVGADG